MSAAQKLLAVMKQYPHCGSAEALAKLFLSLNGAPYSLSECLACLDSANCEIALAYITARAKRQVQYIDDAEILVFVANEYSDLNDLADAANNFKAQWVREYRVSLPAKEVA